MGTRCHHRPKGLVMTTSDPTTDHTPESLAGRVRRPPWSAPRCRASRPRLSPLQPPVAADRLRVEQPRPIGAAGRRRLLPGGLRDRDDPDLGRDRHRCQHRHLSPPRGPDEHGETVWYVLTDTSDFATARRLGLNWSPKLANAPQAAMRTATMADDGSLEFDQGDRRLQPRPGRRRWRGAELLSTGRSRSRLGW